MRPKKREGSIGRTPTTYCTRGAVPGDITCPFFSPALAAEVCGANASPQTFCGILDRMYDDEKSTLQISGVGLAFLLDVR